MQSYDLGEGRSSERTNPNVKNFYLCLIGLGAGQLFCGIAALALGIANAIVCGLLGSIGYGIWGSLIYFAAGITGILAAARQTRCMVTSHMILSIIAAAAAAVQLGMGAGSAVFDNVALKVARNNPDQQQVLSSYSSGLDYFFMFGCTTQQRNTYWTFQSTGPTVTDSLLASFAVIQGVLAILSAVYSCRICVCPPGVSLYAGNIATSRMTVVTKA
jgi:hypothetical protein